MYKCCICGKALHRPSSFVCGPCAREYKLSLIESKWPAWAQSELQREQKRRRYSPTFGVSSTDLRYAPYRRQHENKSYRRVNRVRKKGSGPGVSRRVGADNLLFSTTEGEYASESVYEQVLESLPEELQRALGRGFDLAAMLSDAIRSLPLISQRAIKAYAGGYTATEIARAEGINETTMQWLLTSAQERLQDILREKLNADDGMRYH